MTAMSEKVEHTELPWTQWGGLVLDENDNLTVASCHEPDGPTTEEHKANAAYIVLACNSYPTLLAERDRLREALKEIRDSKFTAYENTSGDSYGIGVTDGHRFCANIARAALKDTNQ